MTKKVSRNIKITILILVMLPILLIGYVCFFTEFGDRFAIYHNYIDVVVKVDGVQQKLKGIKVVYLFETGTVLEVNQFITHNVFSSRTINKVKFRKGTYGGNCFEFIVPKTAFNGYANDIKLSFGHFNANWWHVNRYIVDVDIRHISEYKADVSLTQKVSYITDGGKVRGFKNTKSKIVTIKDSRISVYSGP